MICCISNGTWRESFLIVEACLIMIGHISLSIWYAVYPTAQRGAESLCERHDSFMCRCRATKIQNTFCVMTYPNADIPCQWVMSRISLMSLIWLIGFVCQNTFCVMTRTLSASWHTPMQTYNANESCLTRRWCHQHDSLVLNVSRLRPDSLSVHVYMRHDSLIRHTRLTDSVMRPHHNGTSLYGGGSLKW